MRQDLLEDQLACARHTVDTALVRELLSAAADCGDSGSDTEDEEEAAMELGSPTRSAGPQCRRLLPAAVHTADVSRCIMRAGKRRGWVEHKQARPWFIELDNGCILPFSSECQPLSGPQCFLRSQIFAFCARVSYAQVQPPLQQPTHQSTASRTASPSLARLQRVSRACPRPPHCGRANAPHWQHLRHRSLPLQVKQCHGIVLHAYDGLCACAVKA